MKFFDQAKQMAQQAAQKTQQAAQQGAASADRMVRQKRSEGTLHQLELEQQGLMSQLGQAAYQLYQAGRLSEQELIDHCPPIDEQQKKIDEKQAEIEAIKTESGVSPHAGSALTCPRCGTELAPGAQFCPSCGQPMTAPSAAGQPATSLCPNCHAPIAGGSGFCGTCGQAIKA